MRKNIIKDRKVKDLIYTLSSNIITLLVGVVITFLIPKELSIGEYGYLKIFTFYVGYIGFFHFGFNDGIYVNYGNYEYEDLPKKTFRGYFRFLLAFQGLVSILIIALAIAFSGDKIRTIIYISLGVNALILNITGYFEFISQIIRKFKFYSITLVLNKVMYIIGTIFLILSNYNGAIHFIILQTIINLIILVIYLSKYKELVFGDSKGIIELKDDVKNNMSMGFFIMLGNFVSIIIIGVDRIFIDKFFTLEDFAMYSFAVSLLSMVYVILNGVRSVAYPYLSRINEGDLKRTYEIMKTVIFIILGYCLMAYFIFSVIVTNFIPQYSAALGVTSIIFPTVLFSGEINIVTTNFYKTLKLKKEYTINTIVAVVISLITIITAFIMFGTKEAIAASSLISFCLWGFYGDRFFSKYIGVNTIKHNIGEILTVILFLFLAFKFKWYIAIVLYFVGFTSISIVLFKNEIVNSINSLKKKNSTE
ncbi:MULTISPECIES: oligosaccharide flippase family protein [unclassified Clostridium]|uniref:oligosaccharide flippase family protein n=1 Tax=unclassified Clostridium TaxID=2614128 RepID=UPI0032163AA7